MKRTRLFGSEIEFDPVATERGYEQIGQPDPSCCDACAAFADVTLRRALPIAFTSRLVELGIDPAKPQEVYGTPAVGALAGWYVFVGRLHTIWCGEAESAFAELDPGFRSWVTDRLVVHSWERSPEASGLVQLEFDWRDRGLAEISRASRSRGRRPPVVGEVGRFMLAQRNRRATVPPDLRAFPTTRQTTRMESDRGAVDAEDAAAEVRHALAATARFPR